MSDDEDERRRSRRNSDDEVRDEPKRSRSRSPRQSPQRKSRSKSGERNNKSETENKHGLSLLVRNLPYSASVDNLREDFSRYGEIRDVYIPRDYHTGQIKTKRQSYIVNILKILKKRKRKDSDFKVY